MERFVVISGLSGSGKSLAGNCLEDLGFFCVDNLPVQLIPQFHNLVRHSTPPIERAALIVDLREAGFQDQFPEMLNRLREGPGPVELLFFECSPEVQKRRFSETRRPHPLAPTSPTLEGAIHAERDAMAPVRDKADRIIDTSKFTAHQLRAFLKNAYGTHDEETRLNVTVMSFGFKYGLPTEADLVFDVRFLPNPYFVEGLRGLTGLDAPVREYVEGQPETSEFRDRLLAFMDFLLPLYIKEGKSYLTAAIGCTGGKHRSVAMTQWLADHLQGGAYAVAVQHRDLGKE